VKSSSSTDFTSADGRSFAIPVGAAFLLLAALFFWREREALFRITAGLGGVLLVAGALVPGKLGPAYRGWMKTAFAISRITTPIFLAIVYFLMMTPTGLLMRLFGRRPIVHEERNESFWRSTEGRRRGDLRRQF